MSAPASTLDEAPHITTVGSHEDSPKGETQERKTLNKLNWHLATLCGGAFLISYIDRGNIGYAASEMCRSLRLNHAEYGLGASVFYIGYILSQLGSNVMLKRLGAPVWLSFILFIWGCAAALMSFMQSAVHFYLLRVLLGLAEGGTFPGVWYYLTLFYPDRHLVEPYAAVNAGVALSMPVSAPLAAGLLSLDGLLGITGWRILFFVEGLIPIIYSVFIFSYLPASVDSATFLNSEEKKWIHFEHGRRETESSICRNLKNEIFEIFQSTQFRLLTIGFALFSGCMVTLMYWQTLIIQDMLNGSDDDDRDNSTCSSGDNSAVAVILTAIPHGLAGAFCLVTAKHLPRIQNRTLMSGSICLFSAFSLTSWVFTRNVSFVLGFLSLVFTSVLSAMPFNLLIGSVATLFPQSMRGTAIALFNSLANMGPFVFPFVTGAIVDASGYTTAICLVGLAMLLSACFFFAVKDPQMTTREEESNGTLSECRTPLMPQSNPE